MRFRTGFLVLVGLLAATASAQWPNSRSQSLIIADRTSEQVQPKIAPTADGGCYVSWFDNAAGGYDVYLQRLDRFGVEQWAHNGILIADRGFSSTTDYDLDVDAGGNAILAFNDDRSGANQITAQRVSPQGTLLWGANGVMCSSGTAFKASPKIVELSDGSFAVGWSGQNIASMVKVSAMGVVLGSQIDIVETGRAILMDDMVASTDGAWIAMYWRCWTTNSVTSAKHLYSARFTSSGTQDWMTIVYGPLGAPYGAQGGSIQNGTFPPIHSDGAGGFVTAWYEISGPRRAYVQHIRVDGTQQFPTATPTGISVTGDMPGRIQVGASVAYDVANQAYYVAAWDTNDGAQNQNRVFVQKLDAQGNRLWGEAGLTVIPTNANQPSFVQALLACDGMQVFGFDSRSVTTGVVFGAGVSAVGTALWGVASPSLPCEDDSGKARLAIARAGQGSLLVWTNGPSGSGDVWGQRVDDGGAVGNVVFGIVTVEDSVTGIPKEAIAELWQGATLVATVPVHVCPDNVMSFATSLRGVFDLRYKSMHTLTRLVAGVTIGDLGAVVGSLTLVNGDVDGDNEVSIGDYAILSFAFGTSPGDPNWVESADLTDDESVDIGDFAVLSANFGMVGE